MKDTVVAWAKDPDGGFSFIGDNIAKLIGFTPDEIGPESPMVSPLSENGLWKDIVGQEAAKKEPPLTARCYSVEVQCKNGSRTVLEVIALFLRSAGNLIKSAGIVRALDRCPVCSGRFLKALDEMVFAYRQSVTI